MIHESKGMNKSLAPLWGRGLTGSPCADMFVVQQQSEVCEKGIIKISVFVYSVAQVQKEMQQADHCRCVRSQICPFVQT